MKICELGKTEYLSPEIYVTVMTVEQGFQVSIEYAGFDDADGDSEWGEI